MSSPFKLIKGGKSDAVIATPAIKTGTRIGMLKANDPRARAARVELDGADVTRGIWSDDKSERYPIAACDDGEGWIAYLGPIEPGSAIKGLQFKRGNVRIYLNTPSDEALAAMNITKGEPS